MLNLFEVTLIINLRIIHAKFLSFSLTYHTSFIYYSVIVTLN